jgi:hypothetical protein
MFLLDDILLSPVKALMAIGRHIQETAGKNLEDQEKAILNDLSELHQLLESGAVSDTEFDTRETVLLDRLDMIQRVLEAGSDEEDGREV